MVEFEAAPAIPRDYKNLDVLTIEEVRKAELAGYVAASSDLGVIFKRSGEREEMWTPPQDIKDWRLRVCLVWFCYIYENLEKLARPLGAIEEMLFEFKFPKILDIPEHEYLGHTYAGAAAFDPITAKELVQEKQYLAPHYLDALAAIDSYRSQIK